MQFRGPEKSITFTYDPEGVAVRPSVGERSATEAAYEQCVVQVDEVQSCTLAVWLDGFAYGRNTSQITFPLLIEWKLFLGIGGCMPDLDPPKGVTIFKSQTDMATRSGRLFQVDCAVHRTAWLCARILNPVGTAQLQANLRFLFWPLSGRPETIVGTAIG